MTFYRNRDPINLLYAQPWTSWTNAFKCYICEDGNYHSICYELAYKFRLPDGTDDVNRRYFSQVCTYCMRDLLDRDPEMNTQEYWDQHITLYHQFAELELINKDWLTSKNLKVPVTKDEIKEPPQEEEQMPNLGEPPQDEEQIPKLEEPPQDEEQIPKVEEPSQDGEQIPKLEELPQKEEQVEETNPKKRQKIII